MTFPRPRTSGGIMPKNKPRPESGKTRTRDILLFRWAEFTVLEDFILRVIESKGGCSDKEIANVLCLAAEDVTITIDGSKAFVNVQGDKSRRTLADTSSRKEPDGIAVVAFQGGQNGDKPPKALQAEEDADIAKLLSKAPDADDADLSHEQRKWRDAKKARVYRLAVTVTDRKDKRIYRCGDDEIPPSMLQALGGFFPRKDKKKPAKKAAP